MPEVFLHGAAVALELPGREAERAQRLERGGLRGAVRHEQKALLLAPGGEPEHLRLGRLLGERPLHLRFIRRGRERSGDEGHRAGVLELERDVQRLPRAQRRFVGGQARHARLQLADAAQTAGDLVGEGEHGGQVLLVEEGLFGDLRPCGEQGRLLRCGAAERVERRREPPQVALPLGERRALPVQQLRLFLRLADLDAAQAQQRLHQRLAVALQGDELETLHFCDGHAIFPPPF